LRCWKLCRIHDPSIGGNDRIVRQSLRLLEPQPVLFGGHGSRPARGPLNAEPLRPWIHIRMRCLSTFRGCSEEGPPSACSQRSSPSPQSHVALARVPQEPWRLLSSSRLLPARARRRRQTAGRHPRFRLVATSALVHRRGKTSASGACPASH
jgi:hypothetical protein